MDLEKLGPAVAIFPVEVALVALVLEAVGLVLWHRFGCRGPEPRSVLPNLAAGAFLLLALRACLDGAGGGVILFCLSLALLAHLADLYGRWPR